MMGLEFLTRRKWRQLWWRIQGGPHMPQLGIREQATSLSMALSGFCGPLRAFPVRRRISRPVAWAIIAAAYLCGFGASVFYAGQVLLDPHARDDFSSSRSDWTTTVPDLLSHLGVIAATTSVALLLVAYCCGPRIVPGWHGARHELRAGGVTAIATATAFMAAAPINGWLGYGGYPLPNHLSAQDVVFDLPRMALAGVGEEPLFTVLIPVALRAAGYRWPSVLLVSAGLRVAFHVYYGPGAILLAVWAVVAVVVVQRTGCLWGVCLIHGVWDLSGFLLHVDQPLAALLALIGFATVLYAAITALSRGYRRYDDAENTTRRSKLTRVAEPNVRSDGRWPT